MSSTSGIKASEELVDKFQTFLNEPAQRALTVVIEGESLVPGKAIELSVGPSRDALDRVGEICQDDALYIIFKDIPHEKHIDELLFISYVPESANVRSKMLYASSRNALLRGLGSEHFHDSLFATSKHDVSGIGYDQHQKQKLLKPPLTREEESKFHLQHGDEIASNQPQSLYHLSSTAAGAASSGLNIPLTSEAENALKTNLQSAGDLVILSVSPQQEQVQLHQLHSGVNEPEAVAEYIGDKEARYSFYIPPNSQDDASTIFIYTCPESTSVKERMIHASNRAGIESTARSLGVNIKSRAEGSSGFDVKDKLMELQESADESSKTSIGTANNRGRFARPKRPGR